MICLCKLDHNGLSANHNIDLQYQQSEFYMHAHQWLELYYFISGDVRYRVEGTIYTLEPGDIMLMRSGEVHTLLVDGDSQPYERMNIHFAPSLLTESLNGKLLSPFLDRPLGQMNRYGADVLSKSFVHECLKRLFDPESAHIRSRTMCFLLPVLQEIYDIWQKQKPATAVPQEQLASQMVSFINQHLFEIDNLQQLEDAFYFSRSQIHRIFRKYTGTSLWNYVQIKRLFAAREQIQQGISTSNAATACGYKDYSSFFRAYKKQFGKSPKEDYIKAV